MYALKKEGIETATIWPPVAGMYEIYRSDDERWHGVKIWFGAPIDPETGEELDRSPRWQATVDEEDTDIHNVWPTVWGRPLNEEQYYSMILGERE
jgi:hypothetical protein